METAPWSVRLVGWVLGGWALFLVAVSILSMFAFPPHLLADPLALLALVVLAGLPLAGSVGTIQSRRWGWVVALLAVAEWLTIGLIGFVATSIPMPGVENDGADSTAPVLLIVPALAMLGALLSPPAVRWLAGTTGNAPPS
jgi:hypothetical protein